MRRHLYLFAAFCFAVAAVVGLSVEPAAAPPVWSHPFLSHPHQSGPQNISGNNLEVSNRSYVGFDDETCLTISNSNNVYIHDIDFDSCGGGLFLINVTGKVRIENIRARNTGDGTIGSGHGNVIQLNNTWQGGLTSDPTAGIRHIKAYGGDTEDAISVYKSGGLDAQHMLVLGDIHVEHPLSGPLAWSSGSGTCANLADDGGHDIKLMNSTFLNCGAVGLQMNEPDRNVRSVDNTVYGAARPTSNVGLSQWADQNCPGSCPGNWYARNRVWWVKSNGSASPLWFSGTYPVGDISNVKQDATINPANMRVVL